MGTAAAPGMAGPKPQQRLVRGRLQRGGEGGSADRAGAAAAACRLPRRVPPAADALSAWPVTDLIQSTRFTAGCLSRSLIRRRQAGATAVVIPSSLPASAARPRPRRAHPRACCTGAGRGAAVCEFHGLDTVQLAVTAHS